MIIMTEEIEKMIITREIEMMTEAGRIQKTIFM